MATSARAWTCPPIIRRGECRYRDRSRPIRKRRSTPKMTSPRYSKKLSVDETRLKLRSNPPCPLFQRGNFSWTILNPSLEKHALSIVEGRGRGDFWRNGAGIISEFLGQDTRFESRKCGNG